jgi:hypothetical protein
MVLLSRFCWSLLLVACVVNGPNSVNTVSLLSQGVYTCWTLADVLIYDHLKPAYTPGSMGVYPPISNSEMRYTGVGTLD